MAQSYKKKEDNIRPCEMIPKWNQKATEMKMQLQSDPQRLTL